MGIYGDIKKLHMDHSKLLFAIFKIYERGLISQQDKVILKSKKLHVNILERVIKSDEKLFEVLHRFTQTGENDQDYLEKGLVKIAQELNKREISPPPVEESEKVSEHLIAQNTQKSFQELVIMIEIQIHKSSPYGTVLYNMKKTRGDKRPSLFDEEEQEEATISPMKRPKGLRVQHPNRLTFHQPVNERDLDFDDSDEDDDEGPSKILPEACFGGKSPAIEDTSKFMKLRETKK